MTKYYFNIKISINHHSVDVMHNAQFHCDTLQIVLIKIKSINILLNRFKTNFFY